MAYSTAYRTFLRSQKKEHRFLVKYEPVDRSGNPVTLYRSTDGYATRPTDTLVSQLFEADLVTPFSFVSKVDLDNLAGIVPSAAGGKLVHRNDCGELDGWRSDYYFDGRRATVYHGGWSEETGELAFADYAIVYSGEVKGQPLPGLADVEVQLGPTDQRFDFQFSDRVHCGLPWHVYFDGSDDYVTCGNHSAHDMTGAFTIEGRLLAPASPAGQSVIFSRSSPNVDGFRVEYTSARKLRLVTYQSGAAQTTTSNTALTAERKYSLAFRLKSDGTAAILIDGVVDVESTVGAHTLPTSASRTFYWMRSDTGSVYLDGFLSEVRLWSVARSNAQISAACNRTLTAAERLLSNLAGYWPCDEGSGTTVTDRSAGGHNGTITNAASPWYRALEGAPEHAGDPLPQAWGFCEGVPGILVETNPPIWQLHAARAQAVTVGREGGAPRAAGTVYTTWIDFLQATTSSGEYDVLRTPGGTFVRMNVPPALTVTFDVEGDDTDGTYRTTSADLARHFITTFGPNPLDDATQVDGTAFDAAAAAQPAPQNDWWAEKRTVREVAEKFLRSTGHTVWERLEDRTFTITRFEGVAAAVAAASSVPTFTENEVVLDSSLKTIMARAPVWKTTMPGRRNFRLLDHNEISLELEPVTFSNLRRFLLEEWRFGYGPNGGVRRLRLQARELEFEESTFTLVADAQAEAERLTDLYDGEEQALNLVALDEGLTLDLFSPFYLHLQLEDGDHAPISRLGTAADAAFVTFSRGFDPFAGGVRLTPYREDS